jgi:LysM repeat protein
MIYSVIEEMSGPLEGGPSACPFVAFEDDRDHRSSAPDYRHRCFAAAEPEPRAFPHQERYCLSAAFPQCPIFLDWARQEAAGVRQPGVAAGGLEAGGLAAAGALGEDEEAPAFLAGRARPSAAGGAAGSMRRSTEASASLWSYEGESRRSSSPTAPTAPSSLAAPTIAMARRGPTHPGWENPPRLENFPRLRSRDDRHSNQPLLYAAIAISVVMVALIAIPILLSSRGGTGAGPSQSAGGALQNQSGQSASTSPSVGAPTPGSSYLRYVVQSGDYLSKIALRYNLHLWEIELANPQITNFDHLEVGDVLNIPPVGLLTQPPASPGASLASR